MKENLTWLGLFILSLILVVGGFSGSIGRLLACIFVPGQVIMNE